MSRYTTHSKEFELTEAEKEKFATAAAAVREVNGDLKF
jgi:malate dehydrogenase